MELNSHAESLPLDLANLPATDQQQQPQKLSHGSDSPPELVDEKRLSQPEPQPQQQQHQQQQGQLHTEGLVDPEKAPVPQPNAVSSNPAAAPKLRLAGLVNRVRLAQQQEHQEPAVAADRRDPPLSQGSESSSRRTGDQDQVQSPERLEVRSQDSRRPSSTVHNVNGDSEEKSHHHRHRFFHHGEDKDGEGHEAAHNNHMRMFPKIFSKEGVRNALFLNSATTAFTKSNRTKNFENVDIPVMSLAITGSAVPALWLRRDDKGRRPPPVLFQLLKIAVADSEIDMGVSKQIIFRVELQYGDVKWVIRRTIYDFYKLHLTLTAKRFENLPKFPSQSIYAFSMAKASLGMKSEDKVNYLRETNLIRRQALQSYLIQVLQRLNWTIAYDLYEFMEISALSLTKDMGWKGKEAYVDMKITDKVQTICGFGGVSRWAKNWALLRDSYIAFSSTVGSDEPSDVFIFDQDFYVQHREHALGLNMHHIEIGNKHRKIELKGDHNRDMLDWMDHFQKMRQSSPWVFSHRFGSFAPQREDAKVRYYVDGKDYFHAVSDAILAAKTEIYICDWWLSPELYLRRPPEKNEEFRLDRLLKKKAMEGVMIYIVVYKEVSLALTLDSAHTKIWLQDLHPNIQVQRHPDHLTVNATQFWAHHEKICVVDCRLAFIGGLDLCFGRYDSRTHQLSDYHPSGQGTIWPGMDYSNPRIKDFVNVKDYNNDLIEKKLLARMPWHDVSLGVAGQPARDIARHFVQRWNFVKREKGMKKSHMKFLTPKGEFVSTRNETGWTGSQKVQLLRSSTLWSQGVDMERSIQEAYLSSIDNAQHFIYIENQFFVTLATENGNPDIKNKIGIALVNRIIRAHQEGKKFRVIVVMPLMPAFEADIMSSEAGTLRKVMHFQYVSICRGGNSVLERLVANGIDPDDYIGFFGLRSFDRIKHGKFDAIVEAIKEAERKRKTNTTTEAEGSPQPEGDQQAEDKGTNTNDPHDTRPDAAQEGVSQGRSLASKYLLDPIPKDENEAARLKAIADERKALDVLKTWDESITKRAMNPALKELGYVPAATENSMADLELNAQIQKDTTEAEIKAGKAQYRASGQTSPQLLDGMGTLMRNAIEKVKGTKDQGDLPPKHHKITRNSHVRHHLHRHTRGYDSDDRDSVEIEADSKPAPAEGQRYANAEQEAGSVKEEAESIVEPFPGDTDAGREGSAQDGQTVDPSEFPNADQPGPVEVEKPIVDDELDDFVTEQLYIHSKLMIVDDRIIICGSANINDRSQVGYRDSEIAIIIEDTEMVPSRMNGEPYQAGKMAHALRADLFKEHLGLLPHVEHDVVTKASVLPVDLDAPHKDPEQARMELIQKAMNQSATADSEERPRHGHRYNEGTGRLEVFIPSEEEAKATDAWQSSHEQHDAKKAVADDPEAANEIVMDPLHEPFYEGWWKRVARTNTEIFREVFRCVPDDGVETWDQYRNFVPNPKKILTGHKVTGHLVEFPTRFLMDENLLGGAVEGAVVPMEIFT
ncbi:hypothetical protein BGZ70_000961 [Mortierella alpina]|uniref:Phospholipase n=1 Tax=Mortierella alpina TaxID=64518 RepID=A0A9P6JFB3_MORAP|nr:hypothetical protein BGZ70_000961 [Mortierella alpina]